MLEVAQEPVPHPPGASVTLHERVSDPPDERQSVVGACLLRRQIGAALGYVLERLVDEGEGVAVFMREDHRVERRAARVADADPD